MESPKCKICGERHYGLCPVPKAQAIPSGVLEPYHFAWLSTHPGRSKEWLSARLADGFCIHHLNGDHDDGNPENLLLIEKSDHRRLHRKILPVIPQNSQPFDRVAYQREYMRKRRAAQKEQK